MPPGAKPAGRWRKALAYCSLIGILAMLSFFMNRSCRAPAESRLPPPSANGVP